MSTETDARARQGASAPSESDTVPTGALTLIRYVKAFTTTTAAGALICIAVAFPLDEWRIALAGSTLAIVSAIGGAVLIFNALLADRQVFYERGQITGWHRGWLGQPPEVGDPLIR